MSIAKKQYLNTDLLSEFVGAAHGNLDKVKDLLTDQPDLVNATVDVGSDFESALGGAAHMGRADIAEVLLANGARMDIFCAAMMGKIEMVKRLLPMIPMLFISKAHTVFL
jgi:hypothetical protein